MYVIYCLHSINKTFLKHYKQTKSITLTFMNYVCLNKFLKCVIYNIRL